METATGIINSPYSFTEDNQATMTNNNSDNANGKGRSSSPAASNSIDVSRSKKKKRNKKKNKSNNNNNTKKEVFKGTAKDGTMHGVVITTEVGNMAGQYRIYMKTLQQYCASKGYATLPSCIES